MSDQYSVTGGNGDVRRIVVWAQDGLLQERKRLRDALRDGKHVVTDAVVEKDGVGGFCGTIYFRRNGSGPTAPVQQLTVETPDSRVIPGVRGLFADIARHRFNRVGVEPQADSGTFVNFHILFYPTGT